VNSEVEKEIEVINDQLSGLSQCEPWT